MVPPNAFYMTPEVKSSTSCVSVGGEISEESVEPKDLKVEIGSKVLLDGLNLAYLSPDGMPRASTTLKVLNYYTNLGADCEVYFDASAKYKVLDKDVFIESVKDGVFFVCPAQTRADDYISSLAKSFIKTGKYVRIVTNDMFPTHISKEIGIWIPNDTVMLSKDGLVIVVPRKDRS